MKMVQVSPVAATIPKVGCSHVPLQIPDTLMSGKKATSVQFILEQPKLARGIFEDFHHPGPYRQWSHGVARISAGLRLES